MTLPELEQMFLLVTDCLTKRIDVLYAKSEKLLKDVDELLYEIRKRDSERSKPVA